MPQPEGNWLDGARRLDEKVLAAIYDAFSRALFCYAYRLLGDREAAEDIVAETFHRFLRSIGAGGGPNEHLKAYLYRIAHNLIVDHFRRRPPIELNLDWENITSHDLSEDPVKEIDHSLEQAKVRQVLWKLTPDQRQVVVLKYFEGLSNDEISEILGKPVGAVKSLQHRALNALRRMFTPAEA
ncbi:MAG TPA: sigma-70 family RNA polymerase sigma factor [Anaerolineae bacterium]|nr:sigma-70 family RNA polymerase sigma factor [Anaerolineae bacterium]